MKKIGDESKQYCKIYIVREAVNIIMHTNQINEDEAFCVLRKMSMDTKRKIEDMARMMVYSRR